MAGLEQHVRMLRQSRMSTLQSAVLLQRLHSDRREFSTVRDDARRAVNQAGALLLRAGQHGRGLRRFSLVRIFRTEGPRMSGRGDWIRTSDISLPKRALYQAEPRPDAYR